MTTTTDSSPAARAASTAPLTRFGRIAIVGATGAVGREMLAVLAGRGVEHDRLHLLASARSAGSTVEYPRLSSHDHTTTPHHLAVEAVTEQSFDGIDLALFAAGGSVSRALAPAAVKAGAVVVDNSSAFRMDESVPLVVPEVNGNVLNDFTGPGIIANPNCSTILALLAVNPIQRAVGIKRMVISTYQAASGGGAALMNELVTQTRQLLDNQPLTTDVCGRQYAFNVFSHNSAVGPDGSNEEEAKLVRETRKIWNTEQIGISATCIRVPVLRAHCEAINLTLEKPLSADDAKSLLATAPGVRVVDDPQHNQFPEPALASGEDDVLVGRIRADHSQPAGYGLNLFIAGDQLRKGAALNAIQIAERLNR